MNIFYEYEGIFGKAETAHLNRTMDEFLELSNTIRGKLGKQAYLLDKYISMILEGANATLVQEAAEQGFAMSGELRRLCLSVMDGTNDGKEHPLYERVREHVCSHPLPYQERATKLDLYHIALFSGFVKYAMGQFYDQQKEKQTPCHNLFPQELPLIGIYVAKIQFFQYPPHVCHSLSMLLLYFQPKSPQYS